ncbi:hypothetical protein LZK73_18415 [Neorhizobium galegae]|nr:hypothetical protein LZK73_18415 [Neorhizobium galegae]
MATVSVVLSAISNKARSGLNAVMPFMDAEPYASDLMTSTAASQQSVAIVGADAPEEGLFWIVSATGNVWVAFGDDPVADAGLAWLVQVGTPPLIVAAKTGQKCAVIDAA